MAPKRLHLRLIPGLRRDTHMHTCMRAHTRSHARVPHTYTGIIIRNIIINNKKPKGLLKRIKKSYQLKETFSGGGGGKWEAWRRWKFLIKINK